jgi:hypothetical protein
MWATIRETWPSLREIILDGMDTLSARESIHLLISENWPNLRKLTIGEISVERPSPAQLGPAFKPPFFQFLESHDLRELNLCGRVHLPPTAFTGLARTALPNLESFRGKDRSRHSPKHQR